MYCQIEGNFIAVVRSASFIEHRFDQGEMEAAIEFVDEQENTGKIYFDFSNKIITGGNSAGRKQVEVSMETLGKIGVNLSQGAGAIKSLEGGNINVNGYRNDKGYLNFYVATSKPETKIEEQAVNNKLQALFGQSQQQPNQFAQQNQPQQTQFSQ